MKGTVTGTFLFQVKCDIKKDIEKENIDVNILAEEILDVVSGTIDAECNLVDIWIDTTESIVVYGNYDLEGTYTYVEGDRENPPEYDSVYEVTKESTILKSLKENFKDYEIKVDFDDEPDEEVR